MTTLDRPAVEALLTRARRDVDDGLLPACQVALALDGDVLVHDPKGLWDPAVLNDATSTGSGKGLRTVLGHPINPTRGLVAAGGDGRSHLRDLNTLREARRTTALASLAGVSAA